MSIDEALVEFERCMAASLVALEKVEQAAVRHPTVESAVRSQARQLASASGTTGIRRVLAEARRPKGPAVRLVTFSYFGNRSGEAPGEAVRRTEKRVWILVNGRVEQFSAETGAAIEKRQRSRIAPEDLPVVAKMPIGKNDVSKALDGLRVKP
jgi:hypothetical protein